MDVLIDTLIDNLKLFPFLFITYLCLEYMEHKTSDKLTVAIAKARFTGPLIGALGGILPQCGFSVAAANFYAARVISLGTLMAVFLSTSDEMLPIMISRAVNPTDIAKIIAYKFIYALLFGYFILFVIGKYKKYPQVNIAQLCENENCHCENSILRPALHHSLNIALFIFVITLILNYAMEYCRLQDIIKYLQIPLVGEIISGLLGLIPNCSPSVILTQLYLDNLISVGTLISGTLVNAGVGLLVLFRVNKHLKENIYIVVLLYVCGIIGGMFCNVFQF